MRGHCRIPAGDRWRAWTAAAALGTERSKRARDAIRRETQSAPLMGWVWDTRGRPSPRWRPVLETG